MQGTVTRNIAKARFFSSVTKALDLYGFPLSQPTRSILFLCDENKISYNLINVDARKGDARKPDFLKLFPVGFVPAINDDGYLLTEAAAILVYLCEKHGLEPWYPTDSASMKKRADINFWLHWSHSATRLSTKKILVPNFFPPKNVSLVDALDSGRKEYSRGMKYLEAYLQSRYTTDPGSTFLCSTSFPTIADLMLLPELDQISANGFNLFDYTPYPSIQKYMTTLANILNSYEKNFLGVKKEVAILAAKKANKN
jgi:glutathione S-transferase